MFTSLQLTSSRQGSLLPARLGLHFFPSCVLSGFSRGSSVTSGRPESQEFSSRDGSSLPARQWPPPAFASPFCRGTVPRVALASSPGPDGCWPTVAAPAASAGKHRAFQRPKPGIGAAASRLQLTNPRGHAHQAPAPPGANELPLLSPLQRPQARGGRL